MSKQDKTEDWLGENAIAVRDSEGDRGYRGKYADRAKIRVAMLHHPKVPSIMMQGYQVQLLLLTCYTLHFQPHIILMMLSAYQIFNINPFPPVISILVEKV